MWNFDTRYIPTLLCFERNTFLKPNPERVPNPNVTDRGNRIERLIIWLSDQWVYGNGSTDSDQWAIGLTGSPLSDERRSMNCK